MSDLAERLTVHSAYVQAEGAFQMRAVTADLLKEASAAIARQERALREIANLTADRISATMVGVNSIAAAALEPEG